MDMLKALSAVSAEFNRFRFFSGDCHALAIALYRANSHKGKLIAGLRNTVDEDGAVYAVTYSHMVYESLDGVCWDIDGPNADIQWEEAFLGESNVPDKWGMCNGDFDWVTVPYETHLEWLGSHKATLDENLVQRICAVIHTSQMLKC